MSTIPTIPPEIRPYIRQQIVEIADLISNQESRKRLSHQQVAEYAAAVADELEDLQRRISEKLSRFN